MFRVAVAPTPTLTPPHSYQLDTLPIRVGSIEQLKPGDMVFYLGTYVNPKTKPQKHDCVHVEVYIGDGRTLGARWGKGVVQEHDSYTFTAKTWTLTEYVFCSIDTWLQGVCKSHCSEHEWKRACEWQPTGVLPLSYNRNLLLNTARSTLHLQ